MESVEAGPSRPRLSNTTHELEPETPGTTARRRSWFGLGSPTKAANPLPAQLETGKPSLGNTFHALEDDGEPPDSKDREGSPGTLRRRRMPTKGSIDDDDVMELKDSSGRSMRRRESDTTIRRSDHEPPDAKFDADTLKIPIIPARTSSTTDWSNPPIDLHLDKEQPPVPLDRPLPPLPDSSPQSGPSYRRIIPHEIVVIPSSPSRFSNGPRSSRPSTADSLRVEGSSFGRRSRSSSRTRSRSSSRTRTGHDPLPSALGIGHPNGRRGSAHDFDDDRPPPVPVKNISVSSPVRTRDSSPAPGGRIAFADLDQEIRPPTDGRRDRMRRARSFSGILGRTASSSTHASASSSRSQSPEKMERLADEQEEGTVKAAGVLGWFGLKRTVKRQSSEGRLPVAVATHQAAEESFEPKRKLSAEEPESEEDHLLAADRPGSVHEEVRTPDTPRRPELRSQASERTVVPAAQGRIASLFNRKSSSASQPPEESPPLAESMPSPVLPPAQAQPIPGGARRRPDTADSSQSSVRSGHFDPEISDFADQYASTPTDGEENLLSPDASVHWGPGIRPWMGGSELHRSPRSSISSGPASMPEKSILMASTLSQESKRHDAAAAGGRLRSSSDAIKPQSINSDEKQHGEPRASTRSLQPSPFTDGRPKLHSRSSTGNVSTLGQKVRNVFSRPSSSRGRSHTLSQPPTTAPPSLDVDEFGGLPSRVLDRTSSFRPSSSRSSSDLPSPGSRRGILSRDVAHSSLLGSHGSDSRGFLSETPERSPRTSFTGASTSSIASGSGESSRKSTDPPPVPEMLPRSRGRPRASTLSSGVTFNSLLPPLSPNLFPVSATPPRRRPSAIARLSQGLLSSGTSSPRSNSLFPLPPKPSSPFSPGIGISDDATSTSVSSAASPRPSAGSISAAADNAAIKAASVRRDDETVEEYLQRVTTTVGRGDVARVLASSADHFHTEALNLYMSGFDFTQNALDIAIRRLLMHMSLPRETQQIDRVIEAFSVRYEACEPNLFSGKDNTYVLAFSMMMLHTDAFNKHNRNKMTKADYVRNTRLDGVPPVVLETFYDNITHQRFVYVEEDDHLLATPTPGPTSPASTRPSTPLGPSILQTPRSAKLDIYPMISAGSLDTLRINVEHQVPAENPFSCSGIRPSVDIPLARKVFSDARLMQFLAPKRKASGGGLLGSTPSKSTLPEGHTTYKVAKVGLLSRRDGPGDGGRKKSRKWKSWTVILTATQLLFFKDPSLAITLQSELDQGEAIKLPGGVLVSTASGATPDEIVPLENSFAVVDKVAIHSHTFRLVMPTGQTYFLQAANEEGMNHWIRLINFASAIQTSGLHMDVVLSADENVQPLSASGVQDRFQQWANRLTSLQGDLASQLKILRCLSILTPFQRSARDRIVSTIPSMAHDIRRDRLQVAKLEMWISTIGAVTGLGPVESVGSTIQREEDMGMGRQSDESGDPNPRSRDAPRLSLSSPEPDNASSSGQEGRSPRTPSVESPEHLLDQSSGDRSDVAMRSSEDDDDAFTKPSFPSQSTGATSVS